MNTTPHTDRTIHISLPVLVAAWAFPVFVLGQFAFVSAIPVAVVLIGNLRHARSRTVLWWTSALTAAYAAPTALWILGPSTAPSLSKFLNPTATALIAAIGGAVAIAHHVLRRHAESPAPAI